MKRVVLTGPQARLRAQRWDVVILGSALPGLIAGVRLAMARLRVLWVREEAQRVRPPWLSEPFFLAGACSGGVLDACLRALALPLIDRRRIEPVPIAYQVVLPEARVAVGVQALTAEELVAWRLAKPELARELVHDLLEAGAAERAALLESSVVRLGGLRGLMRARGAPRPPRYARGLPRAVADPPPELAPLLDAQVRALVGTASPSPPPEARARLLAAPLEGGAQFPRDDVTLQGLLAKRLASLHGEVRGVKESFELVHADQHPGIALPARSEVWLGRVLLLNTAVSPLLAWMQAEDMEAPRFLRPPARCRRRHTLLLRVRRDALPEGMARRVIRLLDPEAPADGENVITLATIRAAEGEEDGLVVSTVLPEGESPGAETDARLERAVRELMPFAEERLARVPLGPAPSWDDPAALEDPPAGAGWPGQSELRVSTRPPVYRLAREELGALGVEGEVLLGWQAGDVLREELA